MLTIYFLLIYSHCIIFVFVMWNACSLFLYFFCILLSFFRAIWCCKMNKTCIFSNNLTFKLVIKIVRWSKSHLTRIQQEFGVPVNQNEWTADADTDAPPSAKTELLSQFYTLFDQNSQLLKWLLLETSLLTLPMPRVLMVKMPSHSWVWSAALKVATWLFLTLLVVPERPLACVTTPSSWVASCQTLRRKKTRTCGLFATAEMQFFPCQRTCAL